ncbi:Tetratricopeptide repeat-containing protein [Ekhidna lutea]|uniref:Tetratricopeptide repeat-containing protein n=1 Tax=Ekhidna lutea TaxID=447679 RepID=A0A239IIH1_EKHLU|nr:tetratricopeptide repeat protein [Ekhidna lutea]SNS93341.1 Tetratricopeptide repeat-containing protein [Ekhidna lutea]
MRKILLLSLLCTYLFAASQSMEARKVQVTLNPFKDISGNIGDKKLEALFTSSFEMAMTVYDDVELSPTQTYAKRATDAPQTVRVSGEFAFVENDIRLYIRVAGPENSVNLDVISYPSRNTLLAIHEAAQKTIKEVRKLTTTVGSRAKRLALLPLSGDDEGFVNDYLRELAISTNELIIPCENLGVARWDEAESFYFSEEALPRVLSQSGFDALITLRVLEQSDDLTLQVGFISSEKRRTIPMVEYDLFGDEVDLLHHDINGFLKILVDDEGNWSTKVFEENLESADAYMEKGDEYYYDGDLFLSNFMYSKAIKLNPKDAQLHLLKGVNYHHLVVQAQDRGDYTLGDSYLILAKGLYRKSLLLDSGLVQPKVELGKILLYEGYYKEGLNFFEKAYKEDPDYAELKTELGVAYYWNYMYKEAIEVLEDALEVGTNDRAKYFLALSYQSDQKVEQSINLMTELYNNNPDNATYQFGLGSAYAELGIEKYNGEQYSDAIGLFDKARSYYDIDYLSNYYRESYLNQGEYAKADEVVERGIAEGTLNENYIYYDHASDIVGVWLRSGVANDELYNQAVRYTEKHIDIAPEDPAGYSLLGMVHYNQGNNEAGLENMEKGWMLDSTDTWAGVNLLECYLVGKEYNKAVKLYEYLESIEGEYIFYGDQKTMLKFLGFLTKVVVGESHRPERKFLDDFINDDGEIESWYYNLIDDWIEEVSLSSSKMELIKDYLAKVKEITTVY